MRRIIIIYNSRSSKARQVYEEVVRPIQQKAGVLVGKFGVERTNLADNAEKLSRILQNGDIVVAAGGDGTTTIALNGIIKSGKKVAMAVLPYGNFNDMAGDWKDKAGKEWYPIEVLVNGKHFWYAGGYFSMGMFARSTKVFDGEEERRKLQEKNGGVVYSIRTLAKWYFRHKGEEFLPEGELNGEKWDGKMTDYLAINTERVARIMKAKGYGLGRKRFYRSTGKLQSFWRLMGYMMRSVFGVMPGEETEGDVIRFEKPTEVTVQTDGECQLLRGVREIRIKKADFGVKIAKKVW